MFDFLSRVWRSNWRGKATLIFSGFILASAIVGVAYGVITREGDVGLMKVDGVELRWGSGSFPLLCSYVGLTEEDINEYNDARLEFNRRLKTDVFGPCIRWRIADPMPERLRGSITLRIGSPPAENKDGVTVQTPWDAHPGGLTRLYWDENKTVFAVSIYMQPGLEGKDRQRAWLHELGHAIGLDHDRLQDSVMYPTLRARPGQLSEKDVDHLRGVYDM